MWLAPAALLAVIALQGLHSTRADGSDTAVIAGTEETQKYGVESVPEPVEQLKTDDLNKYNIETGKTETTPKEKSIEELSETSQPPPHKERPKRSSESDDSSDQDNSSSGKSDSNKPKYIYSGNKKEGYNRVQVKSYKESSSDEKSSEKHHNHHTRPRRDASDGSDDDSDSDNKITFNYKHKSSFTQKKLKKSSDSSDDDSNSSDKDKKDKKFKKEKSGSDSSDSDESVDVTKQWIHRPPQVPHWQGHQRRPFSHFRNRRDASDKDETEEELEKEKEVKTIIVQFESEKKYENDEEDKNEKDSDESLNENNDKSNSSPEEQSNKKHRPPPPEHQGFNPSKAPKSRYRRESSSSEEEKAKTVMKEVEDDVNGLINHDAGDKTKLEVSTSSKDSEEIEQKTVIVIEEKKCSNNKFSGDKKLDEKVPGEKRQGVIGKWFSNIKEKMMGTGSGESDSESNSSSGESHNKKLEFPPKRSD